MVFPSHVHVDVAHLMPCGGVRRYHVVRSFVTRAVRSRNSPLKHGCLSTPSAWFRTNLCCRGQVMPEAGYEIRWTLNNDTKMIAIQVRRDHGP